MRAYAVEVAERRDGPADRQPAMRRLLDHLLHSAFRAAVLIEPHNPAPTLGEPVAGATVAELDGLDEALGWFRAEHATLLTAVRYAADHGFDSHVGQLARTLNGFLDRQGHWHDWVEVQRIALEVAERGTDPVERARGYGSLARALTRLRSFEEARAHFVRASDLFDEAGDGAGLAITAINLGWLHDHRGDYARAGDHYRRAHDLFGAIDHRAGRCRALNGLGWARAHEGRLQDALDLCRDAFTGQEEIGDRFGQPETAETMGYAHRHLDEFALAEEWYERAGAIYAELGDRYNEATTLLQLGDVHRDTGHHDLARRRYRRALDILTELQHPDVHEARARLSRFRL